MKNNIDIKKKELNFTEENFSELGHSKSNCSYESKYFETLVCEFARYLEKRSLAAGTIRNYSCSVRLFFLHYKSFNIENLHSYKSFLIDNFRPSTVNTRILGINRFLDYIQDSFPYVKDGFSHIQNCFSGSDDLSLNYRLNPIRTQKSTYLDNVISQKDYDRLKKRLKKDKNYFWYFIVRFLASTGARVSEVRQIKMEDLKLGYLDLYSKGGKIRRLFFPRALCEEAIPYFTSNAINSGFIFITRLNTCISSRAIEMQLKNIARRYHINPAVMYPHSFRHRYAINFLNRFNDISLLADLLGHDSIETTRIYLMKSSEEQQAVIDRVVTW